MGIAGIGKARGSINYIIEPDNLLSADDLRQVDQVV